MEYADPQGGAKQSEIISERNNDRREWFTRLTALLNSFAWVYPAFAKATADK